MRRTQHGPPLHLHRQRDRTRHLRPGLFRRAHDVRRGLVEHHVVKRLEADPDLACHSEFLSHVIPSAARDRVTTGRPFAMLRVLKQPQSGYLRIFVTTPAPTVRPPSRIANRSPSSIATGVISSMVIWMLSPGITISTPAGNSDRKSTRLNSSHR